MATLRKIAPLFVFVFVSTIIGIVGAEIIFRLLKLDCNLSSNLRYHPQFGYTQIPNASYNLYAFGERINVAFNNAGFHDIAHTVFKPRNTKRVIIIGDSFCESVQVNLADTFFRRLEQMLNQESKNWEVINLGVGDYGTVQEYLMLKNLAFSYSPDIVLHFIFPLNDICNNSIGLYGYCKSNNDCYRPYFIESVDGARLTSAQPIRNFLRSHLVSYRIIERAVFTMVNTKNNAEEYHYERKCNKRFGIRNALLNTYLNDAEQISEIAQGWKITEMLIQQSAELCVKRNVGYCIVVVPFVATIGTQWSSFSAGWRDIKMIQDYPELRILRLAKRLEVPVVLLKDILTEHENEVLPFRDGHFSVAAHRHVATALYEKLQQINLEREQP